MLAGKKKGTETHSPHCVQFYNLLIKLEHVGVYLPDDSFSVRQDLMEEINQSNAMIELLICWALRSITVWYYLRSIILGKYVYM